VNVPSKQVSGDFYDVVPAGKALLLAIADVEGKSVPAALLVAALQASLRTQTATTSSVSDIVRNINTLVCSRAGAQQFATFFLARVEEDGRRLTYCNAGHNPPLIFRASGARQLLERGGIMFGVLEAAPFEEEAVELAPGDRALFYTDGITEATAPGGEEYGAERLASLVAALPPALSAREVTARVLQELNAFSHGADPADDRRLVVLRVSA
jgi:sigma-B regulation protein RsbU (phosphoserine phosphatase)